MINKKVVISLLLLLVISPTIFAISWSGGESITGLSNTNPPYLYDNEITVFFNETQLNSTIDNRAGGGNVNHSLTTTKQGGSQNEWYHLNFSVFTELTDNIFDFLTNPMTEALDMNSNNITNIGDLQSQRGSLITRGTNSVLALSGNSFSGMDDSFILYNNGSLAEGEVAFGLLQDGKALFLLQTGLPESAGYFRNSEIISGDFGITNASQLTNCPFMITQEGLIQRIACNTSQVGAGFYIQGSQQIGHFLSIGGGNRTENGLRVQGDTDIFLPGSDLDVLNGSLHVRNSYIVQRGFATGENATIFEQTFDEGVLNPFYNFGSSTVALRDWNVVSSANCFNDQCARSIGGDGGSVRTMETNISTLDFDNLILNFTVTTVGIEGNDIFNVTVKNNIGSGEIEIYSTSSVVTNAVQNVSLPSSMNDQSSVSLRYYFGANIVNEEGYINDIELIGRAQTNTQVNQTKQDTHIKLGDGFQEIFWNGTSNQLTLPANTTEIQAAELNITLDLNVGRDAFIGRNMSVEENLSVGDTLTVGNDAIITNTLTAGTLTDGSFSVNNGFFSGVNQINLGGGNIIAPGQFTGNWEYISSIITGIGSLTAGNIQVSNDFEVTNDADFQGGFGSGGASILDGSIYAQQLFVYNLSGLQVDQIHMNGSIYPGLDNQFEIGNETLRFTRAVFGDGDSSFAGSVGIGTTTPAPGTKIDIKDDTNIHLGVQSGVVDNTAILLNAFNDNGVANIPMEFRASSYDFTVGDVGIGTATPSAKLEIKSSAAAEFPLFISDSEGHNQISFRTDDDAGGTILVNDDDGTTLVQLDGRTGLPSFFNSGNVGIGTASPGSLLSLGTSTGEKLRMFDGGATAANSYGFGVNAGELTVFGASSADIVFKDGGHDGTTNMFIDGGTGSVGIGIATPSTKLHVLDTTNHISLRVETDKVNGQSQMEFLNDASQWSVGVGVNDKFHIYDDTPGADAFRFVIDTTGNVGIGTTNPQAKLHINPAVTLSTNTEVLRLGASASSASAGQEIVFYMNSDTVKYASIGQGLNAGGNGGTLEFSTRIASGAVTEKMRIDDNGNVGIGIATPNGKLQVLGGDLVVDRGYEIVFGGSGFKRSSIYSDGPNNIYLSPYNQDKALTILNVNGNVGIGTSSPSTILHLNASADTIFTIESTANDPILKFVSGVADAGVGIDSNGLLALTNSADLSGTDGIRITGGLVGIGTISPVTPLTMGGLARLWRTDSPGTCDTSTEGSIYYDNSVSDICVCDGSNWAIVGDGGDCSA